MFKRLNSVALFDRVPKIKALVNLHLIVKLLLALNIGWFIVFAHSRHWFVFVLGFAVILQAGMAVDHVHLSSVEQQHCEVCPFSSADDGINEIFAKLEFSGHTTLFSVRVNLLPKVTSRNGTIRAPPLV